MIYRRGIIQVQRDQRAHHQLPILSIESSFTKIQTTESVHDTVQ